MPLTILIIARDVLLLISGLIIRFISLPQPRTWSKFSDLSLATVKLSPTLLSKFNTVLQLSLIGLTLLSQSTNLINHIYLQYLWYLTALTTFASGVSYWRSKGTYQFIKPNGIKK